MRIELPDRVVEPPDEKIICDANGLQVWKEGDMDEKTSMVAEDMDDEERILFALKVPPPQKGQNLAAFKIEVFWGSGRTVAGPNKGALVIWESRRRFHGRADEKMYWCGYDDCKMPIRTEFFGHLHVVCPHCERECHLNEVERAKFAAAKGLPSGKREEIKKMPVIFGEKFFNMSPKVVSVLIAQTFRELGSDADVWFKYHPTDIRCRNIAADAKKIVQYKKARQARKDGLLIYPHSRIMKDIASGKTLESCFLGMCIA